jgi:3-hydroxy-9,10-secoandrosta-1,3,5(10)-triene-9,17-dione monooxygenase
MHEAVEAIHKAGDALRDDAVKCDELGQLTPKTLRILKESGGVRLLQPKDHGGYEAHPNDFFDWVMAVGQYSPAAGWIAGVVGIHPWEIALMDPRLQEEIWGEDPDTWVASPYAPFGRARKVEGGFRFTGRWPYSTGTDHCDWVILGGFVTDDDGGLGAPPDMRHFVIPRADYEILEGTWNVMGLSGTGSKDVQMTDVFIPDYRVVDARRMIEGEYADARQPGNPLYKLHFGSMFPAAIWAGTMGIAEGAVNAYIDYTRDRVNVAGTVAKTDPFQLAALAEATSDLAASRVHIQHEIAQQHEQVAKGIDITPEQRLEFRRNQVRASRRVIEAVDKLFNLAGASAIHTDRSLQRFWRDLHAGGSHICNVAEMSYIGWGQPFFGGPIPANAQY